MLKLEDHHMAGGSCYEYKLDKQTHEKVIDGWGSAIRKDPPGYEKKVTSSTVSIGEYGHVLQEFLQPLDGSIGMSGRWYVAVFVKKNSDFPLCLRFQRTDRWDSSSSVYYYLRCKDAKCLEEKKKKKPVKAADKNIVIVPDGEEEGEGEIGEDEVDLKKKFLNSHTNFLEREQEKSEKYKTISFSYYNMPKQFKEKFGVEWAFDDHEKGFYNNAKKEENVFVGSSKEILLQLIKDGFENIRKCYDPKNEVYARKFIDCILENVFLALEMYEKGAKIYQEFRIESGIDEHGMHGTADYAIKQEDDLLFLVEAKRSGSTYEFTKGQIQLVMEMNAWLATPLAKEKKQKFVCGFVASDEFWKLIYFTAGDSPKIRKGKDLSVETELEIIVQAVVNLFLRNHYVSYMS